MTKVYSTVDDALKSTDKRAFLLGDEGPLKMQKYGGNALPVEFATISKAEKTTTAPEIKPGLLLQKIVYPAKELIERAIAVFRAAHRKWGTEMCVILRWIKEGDEPGRYAIDRPEYALVSGAHVRHIYRGARMGVIHSHPTFSGTPSGIDDSNEEDTPGVYMVIGEIYSKDPSITFSVCGDGIRKIEKYPFSNFDPKPLTSEEEEWWLENVMTESEVNAKTDGFVIKNDDKVLYWFKTKEEAEEAAGEDYDVVEAAKRSFVYTPTKYYGYGDDWEGLYEGYGSCWKRDEPTTVVSAPAAATATSSGPHLFQATGKRRKKNRGRGTHISFNFHRGEWIEVALRLRNLLAVEDFQTKRDFLDALTYGKKTEIAKTNDEPKVTVIKGFKPSSNSVFVQPQKPGRIILLPSGGLPHEVPEPAVAMPQNLQEVQPAFPAKQEAPEEPVNLEPVESGGPADSPATTFDPDETAVFTPDEAFKEAINEAKTAEAVTIKDKWINATKLLREAEDRLTALKKKTGAPDASDGLAFIKAHELGLITGDEANDLLMAEGDVFLARNEVEGIEAVYKVALSENTENEPINAAELDRQRTLERERRRFNADIDNSQWFAT